MLVNMNEVLRPAKKNHYAVGLFNAVNLELGFSSVMYDWSTDTYEDNCIYFPTIDTFGDKITSLAGRSGNIELTAVSTDFGGCGPHYANGLANMGVDCTCVGAFGYPDRNPVFDLNKKCKTITVSEPGYSYVFEFEDGKVIMSDIEKISRLRWNDLIDRVSIDELVEIFDDADIITLVNWSYLVHFHEIYEKFFELVMPSLKKKDRKILTVLPQYMTAERLR